ncbi:energy transduction protein TonB [Arcobacter venerupis]|uniref:Energy transduction protein TonB n=1 Tax=Arcobacter venerupis TaxID=1054033 RepID=A0AAE7B8D5_9BACT|nr:energy transducer TonB [Arcobacter venerupis]QKF67214.1 energy transduction protein TonB [Arcobacter venerupis]
MKRYFNSFFIALCFYVFFAIGIFYTFSNDKIIIEKVDEIKTISLNHVEVKQEIKSEQKEEIKEEPELKEQKEVVKELVEKVVETPTPIVKKKIEKKVVEKKNIKKEIVEKKIEVNEKLEKEISDKTVEKSISTEKEILPKSVDEKKEYLDKHLALIRKLINENVKYPLKAKKLSIEGVVIARFKILENGTVESIEIIEGHKFLQNATIEAIQEASKNFPKTNKNIEIQIPIEYKLI